MPQVASVLLLDDGELDDVLAQLVELGADLLHLRGGEIPARVDPPEELLVTTARHASLAGDWPRHARPVRIAVVNGDSPSLRGKLRGIGFHFLVRRPVHPAALRLLLLSTLYQGNEKRRERRFAVGRPVGVRDGRRCNEGVLVDLSLKGARVLLRNGLGIGAKVHLVLPADLTGGEPLEVPSQVVRSSRGETGHPRLGTAVAFAFARLDALSWQTLQGIVIAHASGPATVPGAERREDGRRPYVQPVDALDERASRVVMGRNISKGGMRIAPHPDLGVGDEICLTVYGEAADEPLSVQAKVIRDDGEKGLALRFEAVPMETQQRLEALVAHLPAVEALHDGEADSLGSVVSEIRRLPAD